MDVETGTRARKPTVKGAEYAAELQSKRMLLYVVLRLEKLQLRLDLNLTN
jgi:hypothetical protein